METYCTEDGENTLVKKKNGQEHGNHILSRWNLKAEIDTKVLWNRNATSWTNGGTMIRKNGAMMPATLKEAMMTSLHLKGAKSQVVTIKPM
jgi:hypothetical protein